MLPPVIFHCGLGMEKKLFFGNLGTILCMGILGTIICFVIISLFLFAFTEFHVLRLQARPHGPGPGPCNLWTAACCQ